MSKAIRVWVVGLNSSLVEGLENNRRTVVIPMLVAFCDGLDVGAGALRIATSANYADRRELDRVHEYVLSLGQSGAGASDGASSGAKMSITA